MSKKSSLITNPDTGLAPALIASLTVATGLAVISIIFG